MRKSFLRYFFQGMVIGLRQFCPKGIAVSGLKRAIGFILQPIENWSRYPEFWLTERLLAIQPGQRLLDLGSPKMFGLLLARRHAATFHLTDIWPTAVKEVEQLYQCSSNKLCGQVLLEIADATELSQYPEQYFDQVYTVSVLEHIQSLEAIARSFVAISRVLKPHGRALVTVPVNSRHLELFVDNEVYGKQHANKPVFFSHEFDVATIHSLIDSNPDFEIKELWLSWWSSEHPLMRLWQRVPQKIRGVLGFFNLIVALFMTRIQRADWINLHFDQKGDLVILLQKKA